MTGAKTRLDLPVIARALILVRHQKADRRARGLAFEHARQDAHRVGLVALAGVLRRARAPALDVRLQVRLAQRQTRRAPVHHATECGAVALPKARHRKDATECIARHALSPFSTLFAPNPLRPHHRPPPAPPPSPTTL